jgi:MYXO-CTERM domain-containing protein
MTCVNAGAAAQGSDGWCSSDSDCKCMGEGATCVAPHCTFTLPKDGGTTGTPTTDASTTTVATDASAETPDAQFGQEAATTEPQEAAVDDAATTTTTTTTPAKSGGCSIGASGAPGASMWGLAFAGVALVARKRRRG